MSNRTKPIFKLDLHFGLNYTFATFHVCTCNCCNANEILLIQQNRQTLAKYSKH